MTSAVPAATDPIALARASGVLARGDRILVAVSGGRDSTALACVLAALGPPLDLTLVLAHVDHGWRGRQAAARDRAAVEALGARLGLPVVVAGPPPADVPRTEDGARRFRYRALGVLARETGCAKVATGHHAGDQAETLLARVLRGAGAVGLAGIPARRCLEPGGFTVIRPLLRAEPEELERLLAAEGMPWVEDETNLDTTRERAGLRARLARRPATRRSLASLADRLRARLDARREAIRAVAGARFVFHARAAAVAMPRAAVAALEGEDLALALRLAGEKLDADRDGPWLTRRHVARVEDVIREGGAIDLPQGLRVHAQGHTAWLYRPDAPRPPVPPFSVEHLPRRRFDLDAWRDGQRQGAAGGPLGCGAEALDADALGPAPVLRPLGADDTFTPLGSSRRAQRIEAWLARQGVPAFVRRGLLVLEGRHGVAWVVGVRMDAAHAVTGATRSVAVVRVP